MKICISSIHHLPLDIKHSTLKKFILVIRFTLCYTQSRTKLQGVIRVNDSAFCDLYTPEGEALDGQPWPAYPRPQLRRDSFYNLNGDWDFAVSPSELPPAHFDQRIRVPFCPESLLSGLHRRYPESEYLFYRRRFVLPPDFLRNRVLLQIGAADQCAAVWVNGVCVGAHTGGYEHFHFDITEALRLESGAENELLIRVQDRLSEHLLPYGKQRQDRGGMWYTPVSGLWQTVWLESVPAEYIASLRLDTGGDWVDIRIEPPLDGEITLDGVRYPLERGFAHIELPDPQLWSPEAPQLYAFELRTAQDRVQSYFALRTLSVGTVDGIPRLLLNGKPYFFHGLLDQGYWSDGLLTPPAPECYEQEIRAMKELGFNTLRKHIKVEPELFYYACDRLGMVVFQDMVNNGPYSYFRDTVLPTAGIKRLPDRLLHRRRAQRAAFFTAMEQTVAQLRNHPCICYWTIFNEGWGQFDSTAAYHRLRALDSSRFIDSASGWFRGGESDVVSEHVYFKPFRPRKTAKPLVLSEFGGYACLPVGHAFHPEQKYGYRFFDRQDQLEAAVVKLYTDEIIPAVRTGLCAAIYTQVSDVEDEINGILSYDRRVCKLSAAPMRQIADALRL